MKLKEPKLKRPEDVDAIYRETTREDCSLVYVYSQVEPYIEVKDVHKYYGKFPAATRNALFDRHNYRAHTFNFLWLILCIEGYES